MRKPPDKDAPALTDRDVASSNATLATLLGPSRTKSWMTNPSSYNPVRPTPRVASNSQSSVSRFRPLCTPGSRFVSGAPAQQSSSPLASNAPLPHSSPSIANGSHDVLEQRSAAQAYGSASSTPRQSSMVLPNRSTPASFIPEPGQFPVNGRTSFPSAKTWLPIGVPLGVLDSPDSIEHPSETPLYPSDNGVQVQNETSNRFTAVNYPDWRVPTISPTNGPRYASSKVLPTPLQIPNGAQSSRQASSSSNRPSPIRTASSSSPRTAGPSPHLPLPSPAIRPPGQSPGMYQTSLSNPQKRQRIHVSAIASLSGRETLLEAHVTSVGGWKSLSMDIEYARFSLLREACQREDAFYVALHQILCLYSYSREQLGVAFQMPQLMGIGNLPSVDKLAQGFDILQQLLKDNRLMNSKHVMWFSQFPSPLGDLVRTSEPYRRTLGDATNFLLKLVSEWPTMHKEWPQRGFPLLVDELVHRLGLYSPTLQNVVFTASRRNLQAADHVPGGMEMEAIFQKDRDGHNLLASRMNTSIPPSARSIKERNESIIAQHRAAYKRVTDFHATKAPGPSAGSPTYPPVVPSNGPARPRQSVANNMNGRHLQSPNLGGHPQIQPNRGGTESPNPSLVAATRRPPNATGQRTMQSNTSSPNLTMNSLSLQAQGQHNTWSHPSQNASDVQPNQSINNNSNGTSQNNSQSASPRGMVSFQQMPITPQQQQMIQQWQTPQQPAPVMQAGVRNNLSQQQQQQQQQQLIQMRNQQSWAQNQAAQSQMVTMQPQNARLQQRLPQVQSQAFRSVSTSGPLPQNHARNSNVASRGRPASASRRTGSVTVTTHQTPSYGLEHQINKYHQTLPLNRNLIPPEGYVHPSGPIIPDFTAAHQAHARSPRLIPIDSPIDEISLSPRRYYQVVTGFAMAPVKFPVVGHGVSKLSFPLPEDHIDHVAIEIPSTERLPNRGFKHGTYQYRLRCIQTKQEVTKCNLPEWCVSDTLWPENFTMQVNGHVAEIRRKAQHGKDLPVDLTWVVLLDGSPNQIQIYIPKKKKPLFYFVAVEIVVILQHDHVMNMITRHQRIPLQTTLDEIKKTQQGTGDDDELQVILGDLTIGLADPYMAKIFELPVNGSSCLHRECFDLETFLNTRPSKPKRPGQPCMIDVWKCPICAKDARPPSLLVDEYLVSVRKRLAEAEASGEYRGLDVKTITIPSGKEGTEWVPKIEEEDKHDKRKATDDPDSDSDGDTFPVQRPIVQQSMNGTNNRARLRAQAPIEIIDLDD